MPENPKVDFVGFPKIPRFNRIWVITEKIDGTNGQIHISYHPECEREYAPKGTYIFEGSILDSWNPEPYPYSDVWVRAGSRNRWLTLNDDNYGFCLWVHENAENLAADLPLGRHFGEWWGRGIQRGYGIDERRFSLFADPGPTPRCLTSGLGFVPILDKVEGEFLNGAIDDAMSDLRTLGSSAAIGYGRPEGIVVKHEKSLTSFKVTLEGDAKVRPQPPYLKELHDTGWSMVDVPAPGSGAKRADLKAVA